MSARVEHNPSVDLWECPCRDCWRLEKDLHRDVLDGTDRFPTYAEWKAERTQVA